MHNKLSSLPNGSTLIFSRTFKFSSTSCLLQHCMPMFGKELNNQSQKWSTICHINAGETGDIVDTYMKLTKNWTAIQWTNVHLLNNYYTKPNSELNNEITASNKYPIEHNPKKGFRIIHQSKRKCRALTWWRSDS